jgi:DNA-binding NarL/FixJ family response regulator
MHQIGSRLSDSSAAWKQGERHRSIVFVARDGIVSDRLKQAIEHAFPWTIGVEVETITEATRIFPNTVSLILIDAELLGPAEYRTEDLFRLHPLAMIAVLDTGAGMSMAARNEIVSSKLVRGVLPLHVRLDVTVSILSLLLQGIEYYPREFFAAFNIVEEKLNPEPPKVDAGNSIVEPTTMFNLTKRENQILELVERGLQNKSIAANLNLSEHTVKIHLHNIITKLGAHNRTEAAAFFRMNHRGGPPIVPRNADKFQDLPVRR